MANNHSNNNRPYPQGNSYGRESENGNWFNHNDFRNRQRRRPEEEVKGGQYKKQRQYMDSYQDSAYFL